jgi:hypothetical protein
VEIQGIEVLTPLEVHFGEIVKRDRNRGVIRSASPFPGLEVGASELERLWVTRLPGAYQSFDEEIARTSKFPRLYWLGPPKGRDQFTECPLGSGVVAPGNQRFRCGAWNRGWIDLAKLESRLREPHHQQQQQ